MLQIIAFLRSKLVQVAAVVGFVLLAFAKLRSDIRDDAIEDNIRELEKADEVRADTIRKRVDDVPTRVRPTAEDNRGYRD